MSQDSEMTDNKNKKASAKDASMNDSGELLRDLFGGDLDTLTLSQIVSEKRKIAKCYPVSQARADKSEKVASKRGTSLKKGVEEKTERQVEDDTRERIRPEEVVETTETEGAEMGFEGKLGQNSEKLKIAMLTVILIAAVGFIINSLGIVDFAGLLGFSEPNKKGSMKTSAAKGPLTKKTVRVASEPPQERTDHQAADKATFPKKMLIAKKPSQASPSKEQALTVKRNPTPTATAKEPVITQQRHRPVIPTKKPPALKPPADPAPPKQSPALVLKPSQPTTYTQKSVVDEKPYKTIQSQPRSIVAKKPLAVPTPKPLRVVKEPAQPSRQSWKKAAVEKEELFSEDSSYPYSVCLGSFKTRDRLESTINTYREKGLSPYWVKVDLGDKGVWFRVFSGYSRERGQSNEFIEKKNIDGALSRHTRYASLIGTYKSQEKLNRKKSAILEFGYCPYIIHGLNGESRLYTGAFYQKSRAEKHSADLASDGIQSQVVER